MKLSVVAASMLLAGSSSAFVLPSSKAKATATVLHEAKYNHNLGKYEAYSGEYNTITGYYDPILYREMPGDIPSDGQGFTDYFYQPYRPNHNNPSNNMNYYNGNLNSGTAPNYYFQNSPSNNVNANGYANTAAANQNSINVAADPVNTSGNLAHVVEHNSNYNHNNNNNNYYNNHNQNMNNNNNHVMNTNAGHQYPNNYNYNNNNNHNYNNNVNNNSHQYPSTTYTYPNGSENYSNHGLHANNGYTNGYSNVNNQNYNNHNNNNVNYNNVNPNNNDYNPPIQYYNRNGQSRPREPARVTGIQNYNYGLHSRAYDPSFAYTLPLRNPNQNPNHPHLN